jgi:mRNA interferase MazF
MTVGEVYWVRFRPADGHEQAGHRPGIVLQDADVGGNLPTVLIVPLTAAPAARRFAGTVVIEAAAGNGLREESVALLFQLTVIDRVRVEDKMGEINPETLTSLLKRLTV